MRRAARLLGLHAAVVGIGWFAVGMPVAVAVHVRPGIADRLVDAVPDALHGAVVVVGAVVALPLLWPVWLALGWWEGSLAAQLAVDAPGARRWARRAVSAQALVWGLLALGTASISRVYDIGTTEVRLAALGPLAVAGAHGLVATALPRPTPGSRASPRCSAAARG